MERWMIRVRHFRTPTHPNGNEQNSNRWIRKQLKNRGAPLKQSSGLIYFDKEGHFIPEGEYVSVYSTKMIPNINHELALTMIWLRYEHQVTDRSPGLNHDADMVMQFGSRKFWTELDCATEKRNQIRKRMRHYRDLPENEFVLFVCPTERRCNDIRSWADEISSHIIVTTLDQFLSGEGEILTTYNGTKRCLPA